MMSGVSDKFNKEVKSMNVIEALNQRYSCRDFEDREVLGELLEKVVEGALQTPSRQNFQLWDVYVAGETGLKA